MVDVPAQAIRDAQAADGELWPVLLAIAGPESGWRPDAVGDGGCSLGYLQMNTCGGLGHGHSAAELFDGVQNFRLGAQYIRGRLAQGASLYDALSPWSARPQAWGLLQRMQAEGIAGAGSVSVLATGTNNLGLLVVALVAAWLWVRG